MSRKNAEQLALLSAVALICGLAAAAATNFPIRARLFPLFVASAGFGLALLEIVRVLLASRSPAAALRVEEGPTFRDQFRAGIPYLLWIGGYYAVIWVLGFLAATSLFMLLFLTQVGRMRWRSALIAMIGSLTFLFAARAFLDITWPAGVVPGWLGLG